MNRYLRHFIVAPLLLLVVVAYAAGQDSTSRPMLGVVATTTFGDESTAIPVFAGSTNCGEFRKGSGRFTSFGLRALLPTLFNDGSGISLGITWGSESRDLLTPANEPIVRQSETDSTLQRIDHEYHLRTSSSLLRLDAAYRGRIAGGLWWSPGLWLGLRSGFTSEQVERVAGQTQLLFDSGQIERSVTGGEPLSLNSLSAGLSLSFDYLLSLSRRITIQPGISAEYEPFGPVREFSWTSIHYGFSVGILYSFAQSPPDTQVSSPPLIPTDSGGIASPRTLPERTDTAGGRLRRPTTLKASIEIYGIDDEERKLPAATVQIYESITAQRLIPSASLIYKANSTDPNDVAHLLRPEESTYFSVDSLAGLSSSAIEREVLNILGAQLRDEVGARVVLSGSRTTGEGEGLGLRRAERVATYLRDVWKITPGRITTSDAGVDICTTERGRNTRGGCVRITTTPTWILDTVMAERGSYEVIPPLLGINPEYSSDAGIKRWDIVLSHDGRTVGRYSSNTARSSDSTVAWDVSPERIKGQRSTLVADLTVEDSAGTVAHTRAPTPLIIERRVRVTAIEPIDRNGRERLVATLYPFDEGDDNLNAQNRAAINELVARLRNGARITIAVDPERGTGRRLSLARAGAVKRAIEQSLREEQITRRTITIIPDRRNHNPLGHDLPEGGRGGFEIIIISN